MAARGEIVFWDSKKLNALRKLAEKGDKGGSKIDWAFASLKLPAERKILKTKSDFQLSKAYSRYKFVMDGGCYRCGKKRDDPEVLTCKACRKEAALYHTKTKRYFVRNEQCIKNQKSIKQFLATKSKGELVDFLTKNINSITVKEKLRLLDEYISEKMKR